MSKISAKKILILQTAFIGDAILMSSFAFEAFKIWPNAEIHLLVRKGNQIVAQNLPFIKKVWIWDKSKNKLTALLRLSQELHHENFDIVFNLHRFATSGFLVWRSKAKIKIGFKENPLSLFFDHKISHKIPHMEKGQAWHEVQRNAALIKTIVPEYEVPADPKKLKPHLPIHTLHLEKIDQYTHEDYVVVAPASVWFTKQWPEEKYTRLVQELSSRIKVFLIGGPDDKDLCERVRAGNEKVHNLCGELNLLDSAALMSKAKRVIVNDSGPLHLASAMNAKTSAIFCSTVKEFGYFPLADNSTVVEMNEVLTCRPCGLHGYKKCPLGHFDCGNKIEVDAVIKTIDF
jgi:lipopolysaccharide heptosyltransferase II